MNNCIGYFNQKHFVLFLIYTEFASVYSIILIIIRAIYCQIDNDSNLCREPLSENSVHFLLALISLMLLGLFFLFMAVMIQDQLKCISHNTTGIETLKKELIVERSQMENFSEAFGGKFGIKWFFPFSLPGSIETYLSNFKSI